MYALATVAHRDRVHGCIEKSGRFFPLDDIAGLPGSLAALFARWSDHAALVEHAAGACDPTRDGLAAADVRILTPLQYPGKVLCAGANYYDHLAEMGVKDLRKEAQRLFFFFKPPRNALVGPGRDGALPGALADVRLGDRARRGDRPDREGPVAGRRARLRRRLQRRRSTCPRATSTRRRRPSTSSTGSREKRRTPAARSARGSCQPRSSATPRTSRSS